MVSFKTTVAAALTAVGITQAADVGCFVNGVQTSIVDLETGSCSFTIPPQFPTKFEYISAEDYDIEFYYAHIDLNHYTDIVNAGRVISIPAAEGYGKGAFPTYQVHAQKSPASNSSALIRKRLMLDEIVIKRDDASDFAESLKGETGEVISVTLEIKDVTGSSSSASSSGSGDATSTVTDKSTTVITVTSCSDHKCTEIPVTTGLTTVTEVDTTYTTYCPLTDDSTITETDLSTTVVTITSCSDHKCTEVPVTTGVTTVTKDETTYTTYCPLTDDSTVVETEASTKTITITSCSDDLCHKTVVPATPSEVTVTTEGVTTVETTWCPVTSESAAPTTSTITITTCSDDKCSETEIPVIPTTIESSAELSVITVTTYVPASSETVAPGAETLSTVAPASTVAPVTIPSYSNAGASVKATFLSLLVIPLAYFI